MQSEDTAKPDKRIKRSAAVRKHHRDREAASTAAARQRIPQRGYSPREAAVALGVSVPTVNRGIYEGKIPSTKILGRRVISAETIDALLSPAPVKA